MPTEAPPAPLNLNALLNRISPPPVNLAVLSDRLTNSQSAATLHKLAARHLTPEHAYAVTHTATVLESAVEFVRHFSTDVFPLMTEHLPLEDGMAWDNDADDDTTFALNMLLHGIPYRLHGFDHCEELHQMHNYTYTSLIVVGMFVNFFEVGDDNGQYDAYAASEVNAIRTVWREHLDKFGLMPNHVVDAMPPYGYRPSDFIAAMEGTAHDGAGMVATVLAQQTDNVFLSWYNTEEVFEFSDPWTEENVTDGRRLWLEAQPIVEGMQTYIRTQEESLPTLAEQLHEIITAHRATHQGDPE